MAEIANSTLLQADRGIPMERDASIVIVRTEWNTAIVNSLENGCVQSLKEFGVKDIRIITVPGAIEIVFAIRQYWEFKKEKYPAPRAFIALGCVIRGETPHFDYVCQVVTEGVLQLNLSLPVPVIFGVLTVDNELQAIERIGGQHGHKGKEAAITALKMVNMIESFKKE